MGKRSYKSYVKTPEENKLNKMVGLNIRNQRRIRKWTQTKLAKKLGVAFQQIGKYERGDNGLNAIRLVQMCKHFEVPYQTILPNNIHLELVLTDAEKILTISERK